VKRAKPPVLTSPWKIGFFVSLMLVVVSSAVVYFFLRKTEISWASPRWTDWNSMLEAVTQSEGTVFELWPVLAVVGIMSLLSYVVITQAVRKYKRYLDSGADYKNLLATVREIKDLEDKTRIGKLQNHPELRDFLLQIRESAAERVRELDEREESLEKRAQETAYVAEEALNKRLGDECDVLVDAVETVMKAPFPAKIELTMPELERLERALRVAFDGRVGRGEHENATQALRVANEGMQQMMEEMATELEAGVDSGRAIEQHLTQLVGVGDSDQPTDAGTIQKDVSELLSSLAECRQLSATLGGLGEEAKSTAINTALKAGSGAGTQADLIQLADDVKDIAAKFGEISKSYLNVTDGMGGYVNAIESDLNRFLDSMGAAPSSSEAIGAAAGKASRCVEQLVILLEKVKSAAQPASPVKVTDVSSPDTTPPSPDTRPSQPSEYEVNDFGFETMDKSRPIFSQEKDEVSEIPGIQKDQDDVLADARGESDMFAELSDGRHETPDRAEIDHDEFRGVQVDVPQAPPVAADPRKSKIGELKVESDPIDLPPVGEEPDIPAVDANVEGDGVIDLYALGAVDYDPALHN
jgi:hypothetical protein